MVTILYRVYMLFRLIVLIVYYMIFYSLITHVNTGRPGNCPQVLPSGKKTTKKQLRVQKENPSKTMVCSYAGSAERKAYHTLSYNVTMYSSHPGTRSKNKPNW